jgi:hypothetical protein
MTDVSPATVGSKPMKPTSKSVKPTASAPTAAKVITATAATAEPSGECRAIHYDAERAHRNARCQNAYCFLLPHGALPTRSSKTVGRGACDVCTDLT